ncbi:MAG TPA: hypothetical protein VHB79_32845 [Polyangiaceae bacterium]|nr:hypothetical protein [Polyangiaceae bacterium]
MLTRAQQYALGRGMMVESELAVEEALAPLDPLLKRLARRRIRKLLRRVELETASSDPGHRLRLAYLFGAGQRVEDPENVQQVRELVGPLPPPQSVGRTGPWLVGLLGALVLSCIAASVLVAHRLRPFAPRETPVGALLGRDLSDYTVALSRRDADAMAAAARNLTNPSASQALGAMGSQRLNDVLASMRKLDAAEGDESGRVEAFQNAVTLLDTSLQAQQLPFFVDAEVRFAPRAQPLPMSYFVQREASAAANGKSYRVVRLWRLDDIRIHQGALGFTRPHTPAAIVLLDQVEADLVRYVLPAAAPMGSVELTDDATREKGEPWVVELEARASKAVAAHFHALGGAPAADAIRIGTLLSRRRNLVRKWAALLRGQGLELTTPVWLFPAVDYAKELELRIPRADLQDWSDLHDELHERLPGFEALRDRFAQGVERHEVQHRIEYGRGLVPVPKLLCDVLGVENPLDAPYGTLAARARDEAAAYLAEIARPGDSPLLDLVILSHFFLDQQQHGTPYTYAALEVYAAVGKALGIDVDAMLGRSISRERFARLAESVWERGPDEVREAAKRGYAADFAGELPEVSFASVREGPRYRPDGR